MKKKPKRLSIQDQAQAIAKLLFTNGIGETAVRLVLTTEDGRHMGGWAQQSVCRLVEDFLNDQQKEEAK